MPALTSHDRLRPSVDTRSRPIGESRAVDAATFWATEWKRAVAQNGERAASEAKRLDLPPLAIAVDGNVWTLRQRHRTLEVVPGGDTTTLRVTLGSDAFGDFVDERRTAIGLIVAGRVDGDGDSNAAFFAWDAVFRSGLDGRGVYRPGDVTLRALDGSPLDLDQSFRFGERSAEAAHFLAEAGFLRLRTFRRRRNRRGRR